MHNILAQKWYKVNSRTRLRHTEINSGSNSFANQMKSKKRSINGCRNEFGMTQWAEVLRKWFSSHLTSPFSLKLAFTLSEVLLTLAVIGVIAALVLPGVVTNTQKRETVSKLKKAYSVITQSNLSAVTEKGDMENWFTPDVTDGSSAGAKTFADTYITPYLNISKNCELTINTECTWAIRSLDSSLDSSANFDSWGSRFFLNDGTAVEICPYDSTNNRFSVYIDINGKNNPNTFGKDVFYFLYYSNGKFVPNCLGARDYALSAAGGYGCNKNGGRGSSCAAVIMMDGWQIKDDYPW